MKHFPARFAVVWLTVILFTGCTYHGKIHRDIYHHKDFKNKIDARVMVVSDKFYPKKVMIDRHGQYRYTLSDGLPNVVADALGTLFTEVEVNKYENRKDYDYIAEIDYHAHIHTGPSYWEHEQVMLSYYTWEPALRTTLNLTLRNPSTGYAVARYTHTSYNIVPTYRTDTGLFFSRAASLLSVGILTPLEIQLFGSKMRKTMEYSLTYMLRRYILREMDEDRINFARTHDTEKTNTRVDAQFIPFMQATVYITSDSAIGSGFFISPDGYIITNAHVVEKNRDVGVILYDKRNILDKTLPTASAPADTIRNKVRFARVLKINKKRDLALLKMEGENFPWLELETNRKAYTTGRKVVAIGAPRDIEWSVSQGIISATRDNNGVDTIQTDTAINGGNSGGPLVDLQTGKVVGVNSWAQISDPDLLSLQRGTEGLNFAISAFEVTRTLGITQPVDPDTVSRPDGITAADISQAEQNYVE